MKTILALLLLAAPCRAGTAYAFEWLNGDLSTHPQGGFNWIPPQPQQDIRVFNRDGSMWQIQQRPGHLQEYDAQQIIPPSFDDDDE